MKKVAIAAVAVVALSAAPSQAANVTVGLELRAAHHTTPAIKACAVNVPSGTNAVVVLDRAKVSGCISEYTVEDRPPYGRFVVSIDGIRGAKEALDITYWSMTINGVYATVGVDGYVAKQGDRLGLTYTTWANCLLPQTCV